ncbi:suppressor of fused domain protein [Pedobacter metabolipauper]|uniref:Suppressor of fused protein SUFU n=1 Tax=Pedobacter metabolipauper TaxID=425513 RepID=A0A4R6SV07_9SPHI|nr:suppressor of fused domain protein [Pedobacter metabolipauper]TDQ09201.1 suppressor of fused protein SUFU [Pedobacter metabolipauper]
MNSSIENYKNDVISHYSDNWGTDFMEKMEFYGPIGQLVPKFSVLEYAPNSSRDMWIYATSGISTYTHLSPVEIHLFSAIQDHSIFEILSALCYYHNIEANLNLGHTVNFGRSWQGESKSFYGLISLPYLDGPDLEIMNKTGREVHFYWLIPITKEEVDYKMSHGLEALELKFDENHFNYLDPNRVSIV